MTNSSFHTYSHLLQPVPRCFVATYKQKQICLCSLHSYLFLKGLRRLSSILRGIQREERRRIDVNPISQLESFIYLFGSGFWIPDSGSRIPDPFPDSSFSIRPYELSKKMGRDLRPVFTSRKIINVIKGVEAKPPLINQHCLAYKFSCDLCDTDYVGYTSRHLFRRIAEHKHSSILVNT